MLLLSRQEIVQKQLVASSWGIGESRQRIIVAVTKLKIPKARPSIHDNCINIAVAEANMASNKYKFVRKIATSQNTIAT